MIDWFITELGAIWFLGAFTGIGFSLYRIVEKEKRFWAGVAMFFFALVAWPIILGIYLADGGKDDEL
jgi:hypothetical protein